VLRADECGYLGAWGQITLVPPFVGVCWLAVQQAVARLILWMAANVQAVPVGAPAGELGYSDAGVVLGAVRATRAARSMVDGAGSGPPLRAHLFRYSDSPRDCDPLEKTSSITVVTKSGELVPATSLCQLVQQAAAEQIEVYREIQRRGLRMPRDLPMDTPYADVLWSSFTGIDKGRRKWDAYQENLEYGHADGNAHDYVPGETSGRILSFLVDAAAIAELAKRQASADAAALALSQALTDDVLGNVLSFIGAIPRNDEEAIAFLKDQCSTDCGGTGADGVYLEVAESEDSGRGLMTEALILSTREGVGYNCITRRYTPVEPSRLAFLRLEPRAEQPATDIPSPDFATLVAAGPEVSNVFMRLRCAQTGPADDFYTFAAAGASEPVVSLPSQWLLRKNAEFERLKQRIRELLPGLAW
jgi:hypothetical protein